MTTDFFEELSKYDLPKWEKIRAKDLSDIHKHCQDLTKITPYEWGLNLKLKAIFAFGCMHEHKLLLVRPIRREDLKAIEDLENFSHRKWVAEVAIYYPKHLDEASFHEKTRGSTPLEAYYKLVKKCGEYIKEELPLTKKLL